MSMQIEIRNLSKNFREKQALRQVNLRIEQGMFGLLGPNGAGKTTLMKIISTIQKKSAGDVTVCGVPVEQAKEVRKLIGYLPQDFSMYGNMTAYEALDYLAILSGLGKRERRNRVGLLLDQVNLGEQHRVKVKAMSGGMKRRLGIAQAMIHDPKVLIVDEPTAGLDPEERVRFRNLLCEMAKERIVILSTHIVGDIEATCEKIAVLKEGGIIFDGKISGLLHQVEGRVYSAQVSVLELEELKQRHLLTGILTTGSVSSVKMISEEPPLNDAVLCSPGVEDAYMYLMHQRDTAKKKGGAYV